MAGNGKIGFDALPRCRRMLVLALGLVLGTAFQAGTAAGVYRWVDEQGKVHYGDRPPGGKESTRIEIESAPTRAPDDGERRAKTRRLLDAYESEREQEKRDAAQAKAEKRRRERNCQGARRQVALYQRANNISRRGPDGERRYLSGEERGRALKRARTRVDRLCK